jgi:ubiquitin-protein ligase
MLDAAYPFKGPGTGDIVFQDIPFHPNVMQDGVLCCDGLGWKPAMSLKSIASFIVEAIGQPNGDHFVNPEAGEMIVKDKAAFEAKALTGDVRPA